MEHECFFNRGYTHYTDGSIVICSKFLIKPQIFEEYKLLLKTYNLELFTKQCGKSGCVSDPISNSDTSLSGKHWLVNYEKIIISVYDDNYYKVYLFNGLEKLFRNIDELTKYLDESKIIERRD